MRTLVSISLFILTCCSAFAQYEPEAGQPGSHAIHYTHVKIDRWAEFHSLNRGWVDIRDTTLGVTSIGDSASIKGIADNQVLSLGDGGWAVVYFPTPIEDQDGFDFAVYENSFSHDFLELAFVEVSSDGINFFRFPASSQTQTQYQVGTFGLLQATQINNLAGKYKGMYGVPFDLSVLPDTSLLNKDSVHYVRIVDVVGSINPAFGSRDHSGRIINDPFPTDFPSGGFDLDAVAALNAGYTNLEDLLNPSVIVYPNPVERGQELKISGVEAEMSFVLYDLTGRVISQISDKSFSVPQSISEGSYLLSVEYNGSLYSEIIMVR